jgi:hypothetical protein
MSQDEPQIERGGMNFSILNAIPASKQDEVLVPHCYRVLVYPPQQANKQASSFLTLVASAIISFFLLVRLYQLADVSGVCVA